MLNRHRASLTIPQRKFKNQDTGTKKTLSHVPTNLASHGGGTHRSPFTDNCMFHIVSNRLLFLDNFAFPLRKNMYCAFDKQTKVKCPDITSGEHECSCCKRLYAKIQSKICAFVEYFIHFNTGMLCVCVCACVGVDDTETEGI